MAYLDISADISRHHLRQLMLPGIERLLTDPVPPRELGYRIPMLDALGYCMTLEPIQKFAFPTPFLLKIRIKGVGQAA